MIQISNETKLTLFYILLAMTFSILMRLIWVYQFADMEAFKFNAQFMINTNDGYFLRRVQGIYLRVIYSILML
ncbi:MAG: hypothetical protein Q9M40_09040 [Sulfurimonas sp.]|nr:hypothetical protein [Sulfurimonas sp.]